MKPEMHPKKPNSKERGGKPRQFSIRGKLIAYLAVFVAVLLTVLWLFQIVFLGDIYRNIKVREIYSTVELLRRELDRGAPTVSADAIDRLSEGNQLCIGILDSAMRDITPGKHDTCYSSVGAGTCFVHQTSGNIWSEMMRQMFLRNIRRSGEVYFQDTVQGSQKLTPGTDGLSPTETAAAENETVGMLYIECFEARSGTEYYIIVNSKVTPVSATVNTLKFELTVISGIFIIIAVLMAWILSRRISAPIIKINHAARQLATGDYDTVFEGGGYREIAELTDTLNYASLELSKLEGFRRELVANVSHDLRTPLTMISGYAEVMRDLPGENTPENVQVIIDEAGRLTALVNDLLDLSRLQAGSAAFTPTVFSLTDCVRSIIGRYRKLTENDGFTVEFDCTEEVYVNADYPKLQQVIYNLVNNAISYTGEDKRVTITQRRVTTEKGVPGVRISVTDTGAGISEENLAYIWDRYFKENKAHKRAVVGTGLGLSIVKGILQLHSAGFGVETSEDPVTHGSTFWFELEVVAPPEKAES